MRRRLDQTLEDGHRGQNRSAASPSATASFGKPREKPTKSPKLQGTTRRRLSDARRAKVTHDPHRVQEKLVAVNSRAKR